MRKCDILDILVAARRTMYDSVRIYGLRAG